MADVAEALQSLQYSPATRQAIRRSKYLEDALASIQESGQKISSWGELGTKLLANALTTYGKNKADKAALEGVQSDFRSQGDALLQSLLGGATPPAAPAQPMVMPGTTPPTQMPAPPQPAAPTQAQSNPVMSLWHALIGQESGGNQAAVSPKGAFGRAQLMPDTAAYVARRLGDPRLADRARTDPAVNEQLGQAYLQEQMDRFGNPAVALAAYNAGPEKAAEWVRRFGMPQPGRELEWAQQLTYPETRQYVTNIISASGRQPQPPAAPQPSSQPDPALDQALGELGIGQPPAQQPTPSLPQAPGAVGAAGPSPGVAPPAPGGNPLAATPDEIAIARQLLSNPATFAQGQAFVFKLQQRAAAPREQTITTVNGVPVAVDPYNPTAGAQSIPIPQALQTQTLSAEQAGVPAAAGTVFNRTPAGALSQVWAPPQGYQVQGNQQTYVQGGPNDPTRGQARIDGLRAVRQELAPVLTAATQLQRNYNAVRSGYQQQNGAGDIAMINGLQRLIDEGVVCEGDVNLQLQAQGINGGLAGLQGFITSSGKFSPEIRTQLYSAASGIYDLTNGTFRDRVLPYRGIVERTYGQGAFEDVVPQQTITAMGWGEQPQSQRPAPPRIGEVRRGYRYKGGDPAQQSSWVKVQ